MSFTLFNKSPALKDRNFHSLIFKCMIVQESIMVIWIMVRMGETHGFGEHLPAKFWVILCHDAGLEQNVCRNHDNRTDTW